MREFFQRGKHILAAILMIAVALPSLAPCATHWCGHECPMHAIPVEKPKPCCHPQPEEKKKPALTIKCKCEKQVFTAGEIVRPVDLKFVLDVPAASAPKIEIPEITIQTEEPAKFAEPRGPPGESPPLPESKRGPPVS